MTEPLTKEQIQEEIMKHPEIIDQHRTKLRQIYEDMIKQYGDYVDMKDESKKIMCIWNIGTYMHKYFEAFPFLFINAMRGSGKSRTLKLTTAFCDNGNILASLTEAVLFRSKGTLAIDEFESIGSKEKQALRELLNAGYKKGIKIRRMKKTKKRDENGVLEEKQEAEEFDAYRPILMANIWGIEEVLQDRCITIQMEKSGSLRHIKKIDNFTDNKQIIDIKDRLYELIHIFSVVICNVVTEKNTIYGWNNYIEDKYNTITTPNNINTYNIHNNIKLHNKLEEDEFYRKIDESGIDGRNLELYFPLFQIANFLGEDILVEILNIAKAVTLEKKDNEAMESKDVMLYDFISRKYESIYIEGVETWSWISINDLTKQFRDFVGDEDDKIETWLNAKWVGRALKRLCLVVQKRRLGRGVDVIIDKKKAEEKMLIFK
jgi:hypothetical protein